MPRPRRSPPLIEGFTVVVTKSTVPVGTGDEIEAILQRGAAGRRRSRWSPTPSSCARARRSTTSSVPTGWWWGWKTSARGPVMSELYRPLYLNETPLLFTGRRTSELIKYAANAFLAMKITFINEIADLCEKVGADVQQVARGIGLDKPHRLEVPAMRAPAMAAPASRRTPWRWCARPRTPARRSSWSRPRCAVNDARKKAHGRKGRRRHRRRPGRQDRRRTGPDLQAQHRRHARRALACDIVPALQSHGRPACRPSIPRGTRRAPLLHGVDLQGRSLRGRRRRRRPGHPHRMGPVPRPRPRPRQGR